MKKILPFLGIALILLFVQILSFVYLYIQSKKTEISFGQDTITTLYSVVGSKKLTRIMDDVDMDGLNSKTYVYNTSSVSIEDMYNYINELKTQGYTYTDITSMYLKQLGKRSKEKDKSILIDFEYDLSRKFLFIKYTKKSGSFQKSANYY